MHSSIKKNPIASNQVFQEILKTETGYNESLILLIDTVKDCDTGILSHFKPLLTALKNISDNLLINLDNAVNANTTEGNTYRIQRRQLILAFFTAYKHYVPLYNEFSETIKQDPKQFQMIKAPLFQNKEVGLGFYLLQVIQRGPRYLLLINTIKPDNKTIDEINEQEIMQLKILIEELLRSINQSAPISSCSKPYEFGDYSKALLGWISTLNKPTTTDNQYTGYRFGDYTRSTLKLLFNPKESPQNPINTTEDEDFEFIEYAPSNSSDNP